MLLISGLKWIWNYLLFVAPSFIHWHRVELNAVLPCWVPFSWCRIYEYNIMHVVSFFLEYQVCWVLHCIFKIDMFNFVQQLWEVSFKYILYYTQDYLGATFLANHSGVLCFSTADLLLISYVSLLLQDDVFLLTSNAMCYNSADTIYFRQVFFVLIWSACAVCY